MSTSVCIINCEESERVKITSILDEFLEFQWFENSGDYEESLGLILKTTPEIIFLDFTERKVFGNSPVQLIWEMYQFLDYSPTLIAISNTTERAYEAIKLGCSDYIVKPLRELELRKSISRIKKKTLDNSSTKICLKSYADYQFLCLEEIVLLKADGNTTDILMIEKKKVPAFKPIKSFESILPNNFIRIHKSYIINTDFLLRINFAKSRVTLSDNHVIPFSRNHRTQLEMLKKTFSSFEVV